MQGENAVTTAFVYPRCPSRLMNLRTPPSYRADPMFSAAPHASLSHGQKNRLTIPKMTWNFSSWVGGVFIAAPVRTAGPFCVEGLLSPHGPQPKKWPHFWGQVFEEAIWWGI